MSVDRAGSLIGAGALLFASLVAVEGRAWAAPLTVNLEYVAERDCPGADEFKAVVAARLGYDPFQAEAAERVRVTIEGRAGVFGGALVWRDASGRWTGDQKFSAVTTECSRLVRAMGLALAVQIQLLAGPNAPRRAGAPPPGGANPAPTGASTARSTTGTDGSGDNQTSNAGEPPGAGEPAAGTPPADAPPDAEAAATDSPPPTAEPEPEAPAVPPPEPPPVARPTSPAGAGPTLAMGAGPSMGFGLSSSPSAHGGVFGALAWRYVAFELGAGASLPTTTRRQDGAGFSQQLLFGSILACGVAGRWGLCALANAGVVRLAGKDIDLPTTARVALVQAGARAAVSQDLGRRWFVRARVDGLVNVARWTARLDDVAVWTAPRFAATAGVDVGVRLR